MILRAHVGVQRRSRGISSQRESPNTVVFYIHPLGLTLNDKRSQMILSDFYGR